MGTTKVVPASGSITLQLGATEIDEGAVLPVTVCGATESGFAVDAGTAFWVRAAGTIRALDTDEAWGSTETDTATDAPEGSPMLLLESVGETGCASGEVAVPHTPGTLTITATSGKAPPASQMVTVKGVAHVVDVDASTTQLGPDGGTVTLSALVVTGTGQPLAGVPLRFTATEGSFVGASVASTDLAGLASVTLETDRTTTVTVAHPVQAELTDELTIEVESPRVAWVSPSALAWSAEAVVLVHGSGFGADPIVLFDQAAAEVRSATDQVIEVVLPYRDLSVASDEVAVKVINANGNEGEQPSAFKYLAVQ